MRRRALWAAVLVAAIATIYGPLAAQNPVLSRDDRTLLAPLRSLASFAAYPAAVRAGRILDLEPLRDFSLWLDLRLGGHTLHFTNLVLWAAICLTLWALLRATGRPEGVAAAVTLGFAVHPAFVGSVAWISARKHLLACLFTLLATLFLERLCNGARRRNAAAAVVAYALALLSQPIALLWPLWAMLRASFAPRERRRPALAVALCCAPLLAVAGALNLAYYRGAYTRGGAAKFVEAGPLDSLRALGRSFFNLALPVRLAAAYDAASPLGLVGLAALLLAAAAALILLGRRAALWLAFFAFPLAPVTVRMTNIFVSDTYLLLPGAGLACLLAEALEKLPRREQQISGAAVIALLFVGSVRLAPTWSSDVRLWEHAARVEGAPTASARWSSVLVDEGRAKEGLQVAEELEARAPDYPFAAQAYARAVYAQSDLSVEEKLRLLERYPSTDPWHCYFVAALFAAQGRFAEALAQAQTALRAPERLESSLPIVAAEATFFCERAARPACAQLAAPLRGSPRWDERQFQQRLSALR